MYIQNPSYVLGFHGLDEAIGRKILNGEDTLKHSTNDYDWLGHGVYFWENSPERAKQWAKTSSKRTASSVKKPFVIGAIIDLGTCFDLLDKYWIDRLADAYEQLSLALQESGHAIPENQPWTKNDTDFKKRDLDCAVIRFAIQLAELDGIKIDSVRAAFWEGEPVYPGAGFRSHNHIQICVINIENCIKGVFIPQIQK